MKPRWWLSYIIIIHARYHHVRIVIVSILTLAALFYFSTLQQNEGYPICIGWVKQAKKGLCSFFSRGEHGHLLVGHRQIQKLSIPTSDDPNPRKCLYILARPQCECAKESLWIGYAGLELWGSTELVLEYLLPPVRCYSFNVFDFTVPLKLWWHHSINFTPYWETHRDALAIKPCIIESSMTKETWFIS